MEDIGDCYQGKIEIDRLNDHVSLACVIWSLLERSRIYYVFISSRTKGPWLVPFMIMNPLIPF